MIQLGNVSIGNPPKTSVNFLTGLTELAQGVTSGIGATVKGMIEGAAGLVENAIGGVTGAVGDLAGMAEGAVGGLVGAAEGAVGDLAGMAEGAVGGLTGAAEGAVGGLAGAAEGAVGSVTGALGSVGSGIGSKFQEISGGLGNAVPDLSDIKTIVGGKEMNITEMFGIKTKLSTLDPFEEEDGGGSLIDPDGVNFVDNLKQYTEGITGSEEPTEPESEESSSEKLEEQLLEGAKSIIEGLGLDAILDKLAELCKPLQQALKGIQASIEAIKENKRISPEEKQRRLEVLKEQRKKQLQQWKDAQKEFVQRTINDIKSEFENIKFQIETMAALVPIIIAQINMPTFIGTGSPNPARIAADFLAYKRMLQNMTKPIENSCTKLLNLCKSIHFELPDAALKTVEGVTKLTGIISQIPG